MVDINVMPNANYITVTTGLSSCDSTILNLNQTLTDLRNLYNSNVISSNVFSNVLISKYNCTNGIENYFQQILTFTQSISIRIQILFVSIYFDYITANNFRLNGFIIQQETNINLSSITTNNSVKSDACSTAEAAHDPLCQINSTNPVCTTLSNKWNFTCSQTLRTTTISFIDSTTNNYNILQTAAISSSLNSWQLGLICSFSILFLLFLILLSGYFYRRYTHTKQLTLSHMNLYNDVKFFQKSGIPQGQAFQRAATIIQPKRNTHTGISWIHEGPSIKNDNIKLPNPYNQVTFVDHEKIYDSNFPSEISKQPRISKLISRCATSPSINHLKSKTVEVQDDKLNQFDNSSLTSKHFTNFSFIDENLTDEDAWMCILEVVNAELALLDEQDRIRTSM